MAQMSCSTLAEMHGEIAGVVGSYVRFCTEHLGQLGGYIAGRDLVPVARIAQELAGTAWRLGLSELSSLARQLEEYCLGRDWAAIDSTYEAIVDTLVKLHDGEARAITVCFHPGQTPRRFEVVKTA